MDLYKKIAKWVLIASLFFGVALLYQSYNPEESTLFPTCPFLEMTGLQCPGCGSQRAVHHLLNLDFYGAAKQNFLLVISIPYIILGLIFDAIERPSERALRWRKKLYGRNAIFVTLSIIISFWILRNI